MEGGSGGLITPYDRDRGNCAKCRFLAGAHTKDYGRTLQQPRAYGSSGEELLLVLLALWASD